MNKSARVAAHRRALYATIVGGLVASWDLPVPAADRRPRRTGPRDHPNFAGVLVRALPRGVMPDFSAVASTRGAVASVAYPFGFEPAEGYVLGPIDLQLGWTALRSDGKRGTQPTISNDNPATGVQHMRCAADSSLAADGALVVAKSFRHVGPGACSVSMDVYISETGGTWFQISGSDGISPSGDWRLDLNPGDPGGDGVPGDISVSNGATTTNTMAEYVPGVYRSVRVESDGTHDTLTVFYDGELIHTGVYFGEPITLVDVFYGNSAGSIMDIDNLVVTCDGAPLLGACCTTDGGCIPGLTFAECDDLGRVAWRSEAPCGVTTCDGDCCLPDLSCVEDVTITQCSAADGEFRGVNVCPTAGCGGACCFADATCADDLRESDCDELNGLFQGRGTDCATVDCCPDDPDQDAVTGCNDVCPFAGGPGGVDGQGRPLGDLDENCSVDLADYAIMLLNFTPPAPP